MRNLFFNIDQLKNEFQDIIKILEKFNFKADCTIVAGSGISDSLIGLEIIHSIKYSDLPGLCCSEVIGQNKELIFGILDNKKVLIFNGRFHIYEGLDLKIVISPVLISYFLGINNIILTNAVGCLNPLYKAGDIMLIDSIINFMFRTLVFSERKNDNQSFCKSWNEKIIDNLKKCNQEFKIGNYVGMSGPSYETASEIRMLRKLGADVVGMSVIHEAISACYLGMNVTACSLVTNTLSDTNTKVLTHNDVLEIAEKSKYSIFNYFKSALSSI